MKDKWDFFLLLFVLIGGFWSVERAIKSVQQTIEKWIEKQETRELERALEEDDDEGL